MSNETEQVINEYNALCDEGVHRQVDYTKELEKTKKCHQWCPLRHHVKGDPKLLGGDPSDNQVISFWLSRASLHKRAKCCDKGRCDKYWLPDHVSFCANYCKNNKSE